jgi:hypothetical protein
LEERPEYPYQNIRTKNFFWGDGDKVRLIWAFLDAELKLIVVPADSLVSAGRIYMAMLWGDVMMGERRDRNEDVLTRHVFRSWNDKVNYHKKDE